MCGIIGYIGSREAQSIILNGLKRLEYRGYDSAGIMLMKNKPVVYKCTGKVKDLEKVLSGLSLFGTLGMGHTRWATHGEPSEANAHPHISSKGIFTIIHNGIIENYARIKSHLLSRGVSFSSETDTEVLVNLIEHLYLEGDLSAEQAIIASLNRVEGAYGILIHCNEEPEILFAARKGSPLVIGLGKNEFFVASGATPLAEHTQKVIYMNDDELAVLKRSVYKIKPLTTNERKPEIQNLDLKIGEIDKEGFDHFMLKEISYIHAEGYPAAEMKHGPIALIDRNMPVIILATKNRSYDKIVSNIQEIKARKGTVIAIVTKGDKLIRDLADHVIEVPETSAAFSPLITVIPLQLFAYHIAVLRGCNVDQPRNLAKSVTVE